MTTDSLTPFLDAVSLMEEARSCLTELEHAEDVCDDEVVEAISACVDYLQKATRVLHDAGYDQDDVGYDVEHAQVRYEDVVIDPQAAAAARTIQQLAQRVAQLVSVDAAMAELSDIASYFPTYCSNRLAAERQLRLSDETEIDPF